MTRSLLRSTKVVQGHDPKRGNKKDKETAERVPSTECSHVEKVNNRFCKPELSRGTDDRKEVILSLTFSYFPERVK